MRALFMTSLAALFVTSLSLAGFVADADAECTPTQQAAAEQSYSTARVLGDNGQWAEAIPALQRALEACPDHMASLQFMAYANMQAKEYTDAAEWYAKLIDAEYEGVIGDADVNTLRAYGFVLLNNRDWPQAERVYEAILSQDPDNKEAHERLVYTYDKSGNTALGIEHLEALFNLASEDEAPGIAKRIGAAYSKIDDEESAKEWYDLGGGGASGQFAFGLEHMKNKDWARAAGAFESFLEGKPESVSALKNLGICYGRLGQKAKAAKAYERALAVEPGRHDIMTNLAITYSDLEQWPKVVTLAQPALAEWPSDEPRKGAMYYLRGKAYEKQDSDYESAISMFEKARSDPHWGSFAAREITRQEQLIQIRDQKRGSR